jgi:nucleoside 2-deoxyribosyltransferase
MCIKTVYLGGAIRLTPDAYTWRQIAKEELELNGFRVLNPLAGSFVGNADTSFVFRDLKMISEADILLVEMQHENVPYIGTSMEICEARRMGKHIVVFTRAHKDSIWLQVYADQICDNLAEALEYVFQLKNQPLESKEAV